MTIRTFVDAGGADFPADMVVVPVPLGNQI